MPCLSLGRRRRSTGGLEFHADHAGRGRRSGAVVLARAPGHVMTAISIIEAAGLDVRAISHWGIGTGPHVGLCGFAEDVETNNQMRYSLSWFKPCVRSSRSAWRKLVALGLCSKVTALAADSA